MRQRWGVVAVEPVVERGGVPAGIYIVPGTDVPGIGMPGVIVPVPVEPIVDPMAPGEDITAPALVPEDGLVSVIALDPVVEPAAPTLVLPVRLPAWVPVVIEDVPGRDPVLPGAPTTPACPAAEPVAPTVLEGAPTEEPAPAPAVCANAGAAAASVVTRAMEAIRFMILTPKEITGINAAGRLRLRLIGKSTT